MSSKTKKKKKSKKEIAAQKELDAKIAAKVAEQKKIREEQEARVKGLDKMPNEEVYNFVCNSSLEFALVMKKIKPSDRPNIEIFKFGGWYPLNVEVEYSPPSPYDDGHAVLYGKAGIDRGKDVQHISVIGESFFSALVPDTMDEYEPSPKTVREIMDSLQIRLYDQSNWKAYKRLLSQADDARTKNGHLMLASNSGIMMKSQGWWGKKFLEMPLGSVEQPVKVIIESELELDEDDDDKYRGYGGYHDRYSIRWPFLRIFSLDQKEYLYVDVRSLSEYKWNTDADKALVLPAEMSEIINTVLTQNNSELFGDIVSGKHGGMVVLANGPSGVGKTMTAEVYSEKTKRPLYTISIGELGTNLVSVEENLQKIFMRAARWNAILLLDEADIFMAERDDNLERSAIVGVFLRLLDYYPGMFFLTTNRADIVDKAFASRITLRLDYPELDEDRRRIVWNKMLDKSTNSCDNLEDIPSIPANGRQIRNAVRLLGSIFPKQKVTAYQIKVASKYSFMNQEKPSE